MPFIPRNDDARVCVRRTGAARQHPRSGNSGIGTHFGGHLSTDLTALENAGAGGRRHVDTKMSLLRAIVPEIDARNLRHAAY